MLIKNSFITIFFCLIIIFTIQGNTILIKSITLINYNEKDPNCLHQILNPNEPPTAAFTAGELLCVNDTVWFFNKTTGDFTNIYWNFGDSIEAASWENPFHIYSQPGTYTVTLTVTLAQTATSPVVQSTSTLDIIIKPSPAVDFLYDGKQDTIKYLGQQSEIEAVGKFDSIWWSTGEKTQKIKVDKEGIYQIKVKDTEGCYNYVKTKYLIFVPVDEGLQIVVLNNILTPNNDGINDFIVIKDIEYFSNPVIMTIYNVWGDKVYETNDYRSGERWDALKVDAGTYYFNIKSEGRRGKTGYVDVIK